MYRLFKAFWYLTMVLFFIALLYTYASLSKSIEMGGALFSNNVSRDQFFYGSLGVFILLNMFSYLGATTVLKKYRANRKFNELESSDIVLKTGAWFFSFAVVLNVFFGALLVFTNFYDRVDSAEASYFSFLIYIGPVLVLLSLTYLITIFIRNKDSLKIG